MIARNEMALPALKFHAFHATVGTDSGVGSGTRERPLMMFAYQSSNFASFIFWNPHPCA